MDRIYNIEDAKKKMEEKVKYYRCRVEAWEKVKRIKTKSGSDFKILSKNFEGAEVVWEYSSKYLRTWFKDEKGSWERDDIYLSKDSYRNKEELTTADELENAIKEQITKYKGWMERDQKGFEKIEKQLAALNPELEKLKKAIKEAEATNTHYVMGAYIKEYLRIL